MGRDAVSYMNETDNNVEYSVAVKSKTVSIPKYCISCMQPTERMESRQVFSLQSGVNDNSIRMPVCDECAKKKREVYKNLREKQDRFSRDFFPRAAMKAVLLTSVSLLIPLIISIILYYASVHKVWVIGVSLLAPCGLLAILGNVVVMDRKSVGYSRYCANVNYKDSDGFLTIIHTALGALFTFDNLLYAEMFARANQSTVQESELPMEREHDTHTVKVNLFRAFKEPKVLWMIVIVLSILSAVMFGYLEPAENADVSYDNGASVSPSSPAPTPYDEPEVEFPESGTKKYFTTDEPLAPLEIETPLSSQEYYYVVLADHETGEKAVELYVHGGDTIKISAPLGKYQLFYAVGETWYGEQELLGPFGKYCTLPDILRFTEYGLNYNGRTITLYDANNDNLDIDDITQDEFPQ